ncbi:MAG: hypothetical protein HY917_05700 [Candidatus Diapherotrites archaeon]|nr:hypothetical protein [Candidatus Diapherotrites archaeon]
MAKAEKPVYFEIDKNKSRLLKEYFSPREFAALPDVISLPDPRPELKRVLHGYIFEHSERAGELGTLIAKEMGLNETDQLLVIVSDINFWTKQANTFPGKPNYCVYGRYSGNACLILFVLHYRYSGLVHDSGKPFVDQRLMHSPHKMAPNSKAFLALKPHTDRGGAFVESHLLEGHPLAKFFAQTALYHHERFDRKGYHRKDASKPGLHTRIIQVVEVSDAVLSGRLYAEPRPISYLKEELRNNGGRQFDPLVVTAFISAVGKGSIRLGEGFFDYSLIHARMKAEMRVLREEIARQHHAGAVAAKVITHAHDSRMERRRTKGPR